jgi:ATP-dependent DNA helicase RecQ
MTPEQLQILINTGTVADASRAAKRLAHARSRMLATGRASDFIVLVRQTLENWALEERDGNRTDAVVYVGTQTPWPSVDSWSRAGIQADKTAANLYSLRCVPWRPTWLSEEDAHVVDVAVRAPEFRQRKGVACDPLVRELIGFDSFSSMGQRDAIRSVYLTPPGSTILVILPTGAGKSLAFQFAALHSAASRGLTVVVVPTVALARDQEQRYRNLANQAKQSLPVGVPIAYHSGLSNEEAGALKQAISAGQLPILFASPESILGALQRPLVEAAQNGLLANFVIDEAHIVAQWGEFRPEFQAISGFRDALLERSPPGRPFRTLLLTATLTEGGYDLLQKIFGRNPPLQVVAEVTLRSEPGYLINRPNSPEEKLERILDAVFHFPRPLLVYTTRPDDARSLCKALRDCGFDRVASVVGGDMATHTGEATLRQWTEGDLDIIVATSAFGLGVDVPDVRAVIHACLPESLDRWYQEVGRAGRDGRATVALLIADGADVTLAERMAAETLIGHERAWDRWISMSASAELVSDSIYRLFLNALVGDYDVNATRNEQWNLRTVAMMVRAGILRFNYALPQQSEAPDGGPPAPFERCTYVSIVHVCNQEEFEKRVQAARRAEVAADEKDIARLRALLSGKRKVSDLLCETYSIPNVLQVPRVAGDCPVTRAQGTSSHVPATAVGVKPVLIPPPIHPVLEKLFQDTRTDRYFGPLIVRYPLASGSEWQLKQAWRALVAQLATLGVVEFDWPLTGFGNPTWRDIARNSDFKYVLTSEANESPHSDPWDVPRASIVAEGFRELSAALTVQRTKHIVFVPGGLTDPNSPYRPFDCRIHMELPDFIYRIRTP